MRLTNKHLAFLITTFSLAIVVLTLYNIHLGQQVEEEYVVEMILDEEMIEELIEKEEKQLEEKSDAQPLETHQAINETAKPSFGNPEPIKTLDEILEERAMEQSTDGDQLLASNGDYAERVKELAKKREEKKQLLGERDAQKEEFTNNLAKRRTSVSYSLVDRQGYRLPPPIYTCIEGGKVVINIVVDSNGNVIDASFNEKSSGTTNGCLVDNAITYAYKASFSSSSDRETQKGTITYLFQSK